MLLTAKRTIIRHYASHVISSWMARMARAYLPRRSSYLVILASLARLAKMSM